jgi:hypothetical protein
MEKKRRQVQEERGFRRRHRVRQPLDEQGRRVCYSASWNPLTP